MRVQEREKWVWAKWRGVEKCSGDVLLEVGVGGGGGTDRGHSRFEGGRSWWFE